MLILDGAGWHGAKALVLPDNLSLLTLPPPDRVRGRLPDQVRGRLAARNLASLKTLPRTVFRTLLTRRKRLGRSGANWLAISVFDSCDAIVDACCTAWNRFAKDPNTITSITTRSWAQVN